MSAGLRLAAGFLTILPVRPTSEITPPLARAAMLWGWLAVAPVALLATVLGWIARALELPELVAGALVVGVVAWGTRALHLDGLADTIDGLGSGRESDRALQVMRRGDVGPMGVVGLVLVVLAQASAFGAALTRPWGWLQVAAILMAARAALALGCARDVPAARPDGLGALFASTVPRGAAVGLWGAMALLLAGTSAVAGQPWWQGLLAAGAAMAGVQLLLTRCVRRLGGMSGDVLGALVETAVTVLAVVTALEFR
ncbi:MAG: adenosylcobinamide-GDP ribazoletransferase [Propionibacteriaceae bacterium]|nr:adenosylcobinamide-GDP ribazoletransferase [Propionibacteriaceae bacterium]